MEMPFADVPQGATFLDDNGDEFVKTADNVAEARYGTACISQGDAVNFEDDENVFCDAGYR
jgi:hypothetical protein